MPFRILRNDITRMNTDAIVNTANSRPTVGAGCDHGVYQAAGFQELLNFRRDHIGYVEEGEAFITPGFNLPARYIIHAVSPRYLDGNHGEEAKLRSCYRKSLKLAWEHRIRSIAFPLISTGSFGYPKEEGIRIAADEINGFLLNHDMDIYLVVFDDKASRLGAKLYPDLEAYIDRNYIEEIQAKEYEDECFEAMRCMEAAEYRASMDDCVPEKKAPLDFGQIHGSKLQERMKHTEDTFSQYLMYLIKERHMDNVEVYKRAIVDKKIFSKIKNHPEYHPTKLTALCLCIGARLNLDETRDLLARAGYALSPCDKMDIIFSYFIENEIYDMIELDIQLEEHGLPCIIE